MIKKIAALFVCMAVVAGILVQAALASPSSNPDDNPTSYSTRVLAAPGTVLLGDSTADGGVSGGGVALVTQESGESLSVLYGVANVINSSPSPGSTFNSTFTITNNTESAWRLDVGDSVEALEWSYVTRTQSQYLTYEYYQRIMGQWLIFDLSIFGPSGTVEKDIPYSTITDFAGNVGYSFPTSENFRTFPPASVDGAYYAKAPIPLENEIVLLPGESMRVAWDFALAYEADNSTQSLYIDFNYRFNFSLVPEPEPVSLNWPVSLTVQGTDAPALEAGQFTFAMYDEAGELIETVTNSAGGTVPFSPIEYTAADEGTHTYTFAQTTLDSENWTLDRTSYPVTVIVENIEGVLVVTPSYGSDGIVFSNTYADTTDHDLDPIAFDWPVSVVVEGEWAPALVDGMFTFALRDESNNLVATASNNADGTISFPSVIFTQDNTGEHAYSITVTSEDTANWIFDPTTYLITVIVAEVDNALEAIAYFDDETLAESIVFTATYVGTPDPITISLSAMVIVEGEGEPAPFDGLFAFALYEDENLLAETTNWADGTILFPAIEYTASDVGTHYYTFSETTESSGSWTVDSNTYSRAVEVSIENGVLIATIIDSAEPIVFTNIYNAEPEPVSLYWTVSLTVQGTDAPALEEGQFTFAMYDGAGELIETVTNSAGGTVPFSFIEYTAADVGTHTYKFRQISEDSTNWHVDTTEYTVTVTVENIEGVLVVTPSYGSDGIVFSNTYADTTDHDLDPIAFDWPVSVVVEGEGAPALAEGMFAFALYGAEGMVLATATNSADGTVTFPSSLFTEIDIGEHAYSITVTSEDTANWIFDPTTYLITVIVAEVDNALEAIAYFDDETLAESIVFTATYVGTPDPVTLTWPVLLRVQGEGAPPLSDGMFEFAMYDESSTALLTTGVNRADGAIIFPQATFTVDDVGSHTFNFLETSDDSENWIIDHDDHIVTVDISFEEGSLVARPSNPDEPIVFTNIYSVEPQPQPSTATVHWPVFLRVLGEGAPALAQGQFAFAMYDGDNRELATATNNADGTIPFEPITYSPEDIGDHTYTFVETSQDSENWKVDTTRYSITVSVEYVDDILVAIPSYGAGGIIFVNIYVMTPAPDPTPPVDTDTSKASAAGANNKTITPKTGDNLSLVSLTLALTVAAGLIILMGIRWRKRRETMSQ